MIIIIVVVFFVSGRRESAPNVQGRYRRRFTAEPTKRTTRDEEKSEMELQREKGRTK